MRLSYGFQNGSVSGGLLESKMKNPILVIFCCFVSVLCGCSTIPERSTSITTTRSVQTESNLIFSHAGKCLARAEGLLGDGIKIERFSAYGVTIMEVWSYASDGVSGPHLRMEFRNIDGGAHILVQQPEAHGAVSSKYTENDQILWKDAKSWASGDMVCHPIN